MYAIVETGGKQYRVTPGQSIEVDSLDIDAGQAVELDRVLLIGDGDKITAGNPVVEGARVLATSEGELRGKKVIVMKYKPKVRYRRKKGHRQQYTRLIINDIATGTARS